MTALAATQAREITMGFNPEVGLYLPKSEAYNPPIGSMEATDAMDQPDPLALTAREQAIVDSWGQENKGTVSTDPDSAESRLPADHPEVKGLESDLNGEDVAQETPGFFTSAADRISAFVKKHPKLSKAAAVAGIVTTGGSVGSAIFAETASGASDTEPTANISSTYYWSHLGGDPLFPGGADNEKEFIKAITSSRGKFALKRLGFDKKEVKALVNAASEGDATSCRTRVGEHFTKMTYGAHGKPIVVDDVVFADQRYADGGAPAWCLTARVPVGKNGAYKIVKLEAPEECVNLSPKGERLVIPPKQPPKKKPPTGKLVLTKAFEDANGNPLSISGQEFKASCVVKGLGKRVTNRFEYNPDRRRGPVTALRGCKVGSVATMMELTTPSDLAHWDVKTGKPVVKNGRTVGYVMKQKVDRGRNLFGFKNVQKRPNTPPHQPPQEQPVFFPPNISIASWDHIKTGDIQEICSYESDPDNDIVSTVFTENGNGFFTTDPNNPYTPANADPGEKCVKYAAGSLAQEGATITSTVTDARNQKASATEVFPIVGSEDPRGEF